MDLHLFLHRHNHSDKTTCGILEVRDGMDYPFFSCDTVEPYPFIIPKGIYTVTRTWSPKFKSFLPLINGVKGHSGIRIHSGNSAQDTTGCILVGTRNGAWHLNNSHWALARLMEVIKDYYPLDLIVE